MKTKKSKKANLDRKRGIFFQIGLICSLSICLLAFEWMQGSKVKVSDNRIGGPIIDDVLPPVTPYMDELVKIDPEPDIPEPSIINVVDDDVDIKEAFLPKDQVVDENTSIDIPKVIEKPVDDFVFTPCDEKPFFRGGFEKWATKKLRYPADAKDLNIKGTVTISFIVDENGEVTQIKILKSPHELLSDEVIRIVSKSPKWKPGKQAGRPVKVRYITKFSFE